MLTSATTAAAAVRRIPTMQRRTFKPRSFAVAAVAMTRRAMSTLPPTAPSPQLNPPTSTLPPPLTLPNRASSRSRFGYLFATGKAYLTFYKTGLHAVLANYRLSAGARTRFGLGVLPRRFVPAQLEERPEMRPEATDTTQPVQPAPAQAQAQARGRGRTGRAVPVAPPPGRPPLLRADYQLLNRVARDCHRLVPFGLLLLLCGELTPLIVVALGSLIVPGTCAIPAQAASEKRALARRRARVSSAAMRVRGATASSPELGDVLWREPAGLPALVRRLVVDAGGRVGRSSSSSSNNNNNSNNIDNTILNLRPLTGRLLRQGLASRGDLLRACVVLNVVRHVPPPVASPLYALLTPWYAARLAARLRYLLVDDELIARGGGVAALSPAEVHAAVVDRGGVGVGEALLLDRDDNGDGSGGRKASGTSGSGSGDGLMSPRVTERERAWLAKWVAA